MKKLILAMLAFGTFTAAQGQMKGGLLVYGDFGFATQKNTYDDGIPGTANVVDKTPSWNFTPGVGYGITNNWAVGLNLNLSGSKTVHETASATSEHRYFDYSVGPFVRRTHRISKLFSMYEQLNLSYIGGTHTYDDGLPSTSDVRDRYNGWSIGYVPAIGVNVTPMLALNFNTGGLGYQAKKWDYEGTPQETINNFYFNFGKFFNFGLSWTFGGVTSTKRQYREPTTRSDDDEDDNSGNKKKTKTKTKSKNAEDDE